MAETIRVGIVSSVEDGGRVRVYYPDRDQTTAPLQLFSGMKEYAVPKVGEQVLVAHLSSDTSSGVVLGGFWGQGDDPPKGVTYRKKMGAKAYLEVKRGKLTVHGKKLVLEDASGSISISELIDLKERLERWEASR